MAPRDLWTTNTCAQMAKRTIKTGKQREVFVGQQNPLPSWTKRWYILYLPAIITGMLLLAVVVWRIYESRQKRRREDALGRDGEEMELVNDSDNDSVDFPENGPHRLGKKKAARLHRKEEARQHREFMLQQQQERMERQEMLAEELESTRANVLKKRSKMDEKDLIRKETERLKLAQIRRRREVLQEIKWKRRRFISELYPKIVEYASTRCVISPEMLCLVFGLEFSEAEDILSKLALELPCIRDDDGNLVMGDFSVPSLVNPTREHVLEVLQRCFQR